MTASAGGDARAFERLYARHRAGLYRFIRRLLGSAPNTQTDEVFQDTWLRVVHARARWAPQDASLPPTRIMAGFARLPDARPH